MAISLRNLRMYTTLLFATLLVAVGMALLPASEAHALEDMPKVTEADLSNGTINGKNWMSGLSGNLRLHELTIPGTHDSGMANASKRTQVSNWIPFLQLAPIIGTRWAKTQDLYIDEQLNAGVRMFDIRVTDTKPDASSSTKGDGGLWVCHGENVANRFLSFVYYSELPKNKRSNGEEYLTFDKVLRFCTDFLREHPTETILLQVCRESGSGDDAVIWQRANDVTKKWASAVNPSTGKSYIYKQPETGDDWHISIMPNLEDVRGQIVLFSPNAKAYNYGMYLNTVNAWTTNSGIADVPLAYENHYDVDSEDKSEYVQAFYGGFATKKGEQVRAQESDIGSRLPYNNVMNAIFVNTSSNGFTNGNGSPAHIAGNVNKDLFTDKNDDPFFNDTRGTHLGWLNVDFVTEQIARKIWISNYPKTGFEYSKITFKPGEGIGEEKTYNVQLGAEVRLPKCMYDIPEGSGLDFQGWDVDSMREYGPQQPGRTFTTGYSTYVITAKFVQSWHSIAKLMNSAPQGQTTTITLRNDITATNLDTALSVARGKNIVINLNGHTINRNDSTSTSFGSGSHMGSAIISAGNLTINGPGTITGGSAVQGGGINITSGSVTLNDVTVRDNYASRAGGGVFVRSSNCSFTVTGATRIEGNALVGGKTHSNVRLGTSTFGEDAIIKGIDTLSDGIVIGVSCDSEPTPTSPTVITESLGTDAASAQKLLARLSSECDYGIELNADNRAVFTRPYKVTFDTMGAGEVKTQYVKGGEKAQEPAALEKDGASFIGWYVAGTDEKYDFNTPVTKDVALTASWLESVRKVSFDSTWGSPVETQLIAYGKLAWEPETPTREGYDFTGWRVNVGNKYMPDYVPYHFDEPVTKDITLKAGWDIKKFTVTFKNEGAEYAKQTVRYGDKATKPADPVREGYWFDGWQVEHGEGRYNFAHPIDENVTLIAQWKKIPTYTIAFEPEGDNVVGMPADQQLSPGGKVAQPSSEPRREGYTFGGWRVSIGRGGYDYDFNQPVRTSFRLYAKWTPLKRTVTFDGNGDAVTYVPAPLTINNGDTFSYVGGASRRGYYFTEWYLDGKPYDYRVPVTSDITLKAQWRPVSHTVFFRTNGDGVTGAPEYQDVDHGQKATEPTPTRAGYDFGGWYTDVACTDGNRFDFNTLIEHSRELFAKWTLKAYKVTFDANGEGVTGIPDKQTVEHGGKIARPADPQRDGYVFAGWTAGGVSYDFNSIVASDLTLQAQWVAEPEDWLVIFESNGGTDVDVQFVEDGDAADEPAAPTREGYEFRGWFESADFAGSVYDFDEPVDDNLVLYAKWTPKTHAVTFDSDGGSDVASQSISHDGKVARPADPTRESFMFAGWYAGDNLYDFDTPVIGDLTLKARWAELRDWLVIFESNGGTDVDAQVVIDGEAADEPESPTREGYEFAGWFDDEACADEDRYDFDELVANHLMLYAKWTPKTYTVTFDSDGGSGVSSQTVARGDKAMRPADPTREGFMFAGWYAGGASYSFDAPVTGDLALKAQWVAEPELWLVGFDSNGGTDVDAQFVEDGDAAFEPAAPVREGYDFDGWFESADFAGSAYDFDEPVEDDLVLYAKWVPKTYAVSFDSDGGTPIGAQSVEHGGKVARPDDPMRVGYVFAGWLANGNSYDFDAPVTGDLALKACWVEPQEWLVVFESNGGTDIDVQFVEDGDAATQPANPTREGYEFGGWFESAELTGNVYDFNKPVEDHLALYAKWTPKTYTVTFDSDGGLGVEPQTIAHGDKAMRPADPTRADCVFAGWAVNGASYSFDTPVTGDLTLKAQWVVEPELWLVAFDSNGGTDVDAQFVEDGDAAGRPADPTREGYVFNGWFQSSDLTGGAYDFSGSVRGHLVLYAEWTPKFHTISFDSDGGSAVGVQRIAHDGRVSRPGDPTREGFMFAGWYAGGSSYDFDTLVTSDLTLKARWIAKTEQWTVVFDSDNGTAVESQTIADGGKATEPSSPTREGYTFGGWYAGSGGGAPYQFGSPVTGNLTLHAKWTPITHDVTFDGNGEGVSRVPPGQPVAHGGWLVRPPDPYRPGFTFAGWTLNGQFYDFNSVVMGDFELKAQWVNQQPWTLTFDSNGGTAIASQSVQDGKQATRPADPTREGYAFGGWYASLDDDAPYQFDRPVAGNFTLHAKWAPKSYDVTFDSSGGSTVASQTVAHGEKAARPANPTRAGYVFAGWLSNGSPYDFDAPVTGRLELKARWGTPQEWTVAFDSDGGANVDAQFVKDGDAAHKPEAPVREGYEFDGWFESADLTGEAYDFGKPVEGHLVLYAKWMPKTYTVTFDSDGGSGAEPQTVAHGEKAVRPVDPTRENYTFAGWAASGASYDFGSAVTGDLELKARWLKRQPWTVAFDSNGGTVVGPQSVKDGKQATQPADPTREGYTFGGWYASLDDDTPYLFSSPVAGNFTLHATWTPISYDVTFDGNGEGVEGVPGGQSVKRGEKLVRPANPTREGYVFSGWTSGGAPYDFDAPVTGKLTLEAQWVAEPVQWLVVFDSDGGTAIASQVVVDGGKATKPSDPTREGYAFGGWYADSSVDSPYSYDSSVNGNLTLHAKWTPVSHDVTFDGNGEGVANVPSKQSIAHGDNLVRPPAPTREGFTFAGWTLNGRSYDFDSAVMGDLVLKARWAKIQQWPVAFDSDGGTAVASQSVQDGKQATKPADPTREGYTFGGWYASSDDDAPYQFGSPVTGNLVLRAKWSPVSHKVTFDGNGEGAANVPGGQSVKHGDKVALPANPTREGYVFAGWRTGEGYYDFNAPVTNDLTLQAKWSEIQKWTVSFVSFDGTSVDAQKVADGKQAARPGDPTLEGYRFDGWFESAACEGDPYNFGGAVNDDLTLFAKWTPKTCKVTFDSDGGGEVAEQEIAYGSKANVPDIPVKQNYRFNGWYAKGSEESYDFNAPVTDDVNLTARWVVDTYSVTFDSSGGSAIESQEVACGSKAVDPGVPSIESYLFDGWYEDGSEEPYDFDTPVTCDVSLVARWHLDTRAVTFDDEGTVVGKQDVPYGGHAEPMALMKDDYTFDGWYMNVAVEEEIGDAEAASIQNDPELNPWIWAVRDGGRWVLRVEYDPDSDEIVEDTTLYARWIASTHTVRFDANGGDNAPAAQKVTHGLVALPPEQAAVRSGYRFRGWYTDSACGDASLFSFATPITGDIVLYAGWQPLLYDVTFVAGDGEALDNQLVAHGEKVAKPEDPTRYGYTFAGWYADEALDVEYDFSAPISEDVAIYAKWEAKSFRVTFDANGGSLTPGEQSVAFGENASEPADQPRRENLSFGGWYVQITDEALDDAAAGEIRDNPALSRDRWVSDDNHLLALYDFTYPIENDIALHARWMPGDCTVSFDADGGAPQPDNQVVAYGKTASKPSADPSKNGFEFKGWWVLAEKLVDAGVADDIRSNTAFDDIFWVTDDNSLRMPFDFGSDIVYEDTTLYARWQPNVNTVLFVDEAGNVVHEQKVQSGNAPIEIEGGSDGGYHFDGWFADAARSVKYDFSQPIHSDTTIYGTWTQQLLTVTFDSNGGSAVSPAVQQVAYESLVTDPGNPVWDGHGFLGWYEDASDELTPDDLAKLKAELNEAIATEGIDSEIKAELEQYRQEIEKRVAVIDGKVKVAYNPSSDHVYSDMTVQAQWTEEGSLATEIVLGDGVPQIVAPNLNEVARALVTSEEIKQGAVVRLKITLIDPSKALPADEAALRSKLKELGASDRVWLDISLFKVVGGVETKLDSTPSLLKLALDIPENMRADGRTFYLLRAHDGAADIVSTGTGATLSGETDRFSTYVLGSKDAQQGPAAKDGAAKTGSGLAKTGDGLAPWIVPSLGMLCLVAFGALLLAARKRE